MAGREKDVQLLQTFEPEAQEYRRTESINI